MQEGRIGRRSVSCELHVGHNGAKVGGGAVDDLDSDALLLQEVGREVSSVPPCASVPSDTADHFPTSSSRTRVSSSTIARDAVTDAAALVAFATLAS